MPDEPSTATCGCPEGQRAAQLSRRSFLQIAGVAGLFTATTLANARVAFAAPGAAAGGVLVVVSLRGGFDGLSAVVPAGDKAYYSARPSIGVPAASLHRIDAMFGLAPAMKALFPLWDSGKVAAVHAVGQTDATRSHFEAMAELERAAPGSRLRTGWLDRAIGAAGISDALAATQVGNPALPGSLYGDHPKFAIRSLDAAKISVDEKQVSLSTWQKAFATLHRGTPPYVSDPTAKAIAALQRLRKLQPETDGPKKAGYPDGELGRALHDVARLVRENVGLRFATVDVGDWDMHQNLGKPTEGWMFRNLTNLSESLATFAKDLGPDLNKVTVVTISEFGRRVAENGSGGLDHGHGNCMLLLGAGVRGKQVHGKWPSLRESALDQGDLAGTTDYRSVMAEALSKRCGITDAAKVFPGFKPQPLGAFTA